VKDLLICVSCSLMVKKDLDLIAGEAKVGRKAGNEVLDYNYEIFRLAKAAKEQGKLIAKLSSVDVDNIIRGCSGDCSYIENTLDSLLETMMFGEGEGDFFRLLDYYKGISEDGYLFYYDAGMKVVGDD
jgi:hypothetical protein